MRRTAVVNTSQSINCHHQSADDGALAAHSPKTRNATFRQRHFECGSEKRERNAYSRARAPGRQRESEQSPDARAYR